MRENFSRLLTSVLHDCFISRDKVYVGCGPTRWCLVFCSLPRLFHRDPKFATLTWTWYHYTTSPWPETLYRLPGLAKNSSPRRRRHL